MNTVNSERVSALRARMAQHHIDAYLIVSEDFHASEYVGDFFRCRAWVSGFTGSAGTLVVTADSAFLWTDGRYFLQAGQQLSGSGITLMKMGEPGVPTLLEWMKSTLSEGSVLGYDGRTITNVLSAGIRSALTGRNIRFEEKVDLVGDIWTDRPELPCAPIFLLPDSLTGRSRKEKLQTLRSEMRACGADAHLLASLDDIAWLYNYRGDDIPNNPVALAYTYITMDRATLYISEKAVPDAVHRELEADGVTVAPYLRIYEDLPSIAEKAVLLDPAKVNVALLAALPADVRRIPGKNPTTHAKALKNAVEAENIRIAHLRDGITVTKLLYKLKKMSREGTLCDGSVTELTVADWLHQLRLQQPDFMQESFGSIIGTGVHGAIIHYTPTPESDMPIQNNTFLLMDTGCQFLQGTTDITRTASIGTVTDEMRRDYTAVLRGHLNLGSFIFREGCTGSNLDVIARGPLWELGLNYNHGTGHGVGCLLNVHEGPQSIRLKGLDGGLGAPIEAGMVTSDEPGIYFEGKYGIRIENLTICEEVFTTEFGRFLRMNALTLVPYDRASIAPEQMTERELEVLNAYHARVYAAISPYLTPEEADWLAEETAPIRR